MQKREIMLDGNYTLYQGNRYGWLVGCYRCKGSTFFPFDTMKIGTIETWIEGHDIHCPAFIEDAIARILH